MYVCMYVRTYVYVCVRVCLYVCVCVLLCLRITPSLRVAGKEVKFHVFLTSAVDDGESSASGRFILRRRSDAHWILARFFQRKSERDG